ELLLSIHVAFPEKINLFFCHMFSMQMAHSLLQENGIPQLRLLTAITHEQGVWANSTLLSIFNEETPEDKGEFMYVCCKLLQKCPELLHMRLKYLIKENCMDKAALLAKACADFPEFDGKRVQFRQIYLVCLCTVAPQQMLMEELSKVDCRDALEMICNLEADGDEKGAFTMCTGFLSRQLLQEDTYCAWELTLFWSKLLKRLETSEQGFLERCRQMSRLAKTVFHLLFFIKVIQSELDKTGLPACIEMCVSALRMESCEGTNKATVCKTISCLLPDDLEVKRACQLTEFLLEPTVDSYYAVETLYNEPDQKVEEESLPIPTSLRCELLLVFKTQWPFDPEFWDWKTLKRHCLGLMGEEASIVSSIDELNDDHPDALDDSGLPQEFKDVSEYFLDATNELKEIEDQKQKNREIKKLREKGFVSARFRNWQAYMQYCVLCDKEFLGHRIVRHAQTHFKDGCYTCPICVQTFETRETLDPHVASHVKMSCKERLAAMKTTKKLANEKLAIPAISALNGKSGENLSRKTKPKNLNGDFDGFYNGDGMGSQKDGAGADGKGGNICPVPNCRRGFKYFRNLIAHVKDHGDVEEAKRFLEMQNTKIVCQYCRRHFLNVSHLNDHLQVHCGAKPYICIQVNCKASFDSNAELLVHRKNHPVFKAKCMFPGCGTVFSEAFKLYDHEAQHYKTFTCKVPDCGKVFHSQSKLDMHEESHNAKKEEVHDPESQVASFEPRPDQTSSPAEAADQLDTFADPLLNSIPFRNSMASLAHTTHSSTPVIPVPQKLPPQVASFPTNMQVSKSSPAQPVHTNSTGPAEEEKEKFKCAFENCSREYCSFRSLTKHMKALHPEFYTQWKLDRKNNRAQQIANKSASLNGNPNSAASLQNKLGPRIPAQTAQVQNLTCHNAYSASCPKPSYPSTSSHLDVVNSTDSMSSTDAMNPTVERPGYLCDTSSCGYRAMTKDAMFKHLSKLHNYTKDMLSQYRKDQVKLAPFICQVCNKNFTRNSNLRVHYQSVHSFSQEQIMEIRKKQQQQQQQQCRGLLEGEGSPCPTPNVTDLLGSNDAKLVKPRPPKPREIPKKPKEKKTDPDDVFSPYRPYRCVHQGCVAAFTIQQNLILHYKAVHQPDLPKFETNENEEDHDLPDGEVAEVEELRCQVKDCSRIFQVVTDLLQHYLQLHKLSLDSAGAMMSCINLGRFQCDQPNCTVTFTAFWKYIGHIDKEHKDAKVSKVEAVEGLFHCDVEGCDCAYSTRSNLLRHTMKKHQDIYKLQLMNSKGVKLGRPRKNPYPFLEKENREINRKLEKKGLDKKRKEKKNNHWTKYGKPILKTKEEASAVCTKRFPLQYPCMIKGCETVASSERNIIKHYVQHGLPKQYLEEQRSNYIHCKKLPRSKYKRITARSDDTDKSEESSVETSENEKPSNKAPRESEFSKLTSEKESTEDAYVSDSKPSTDASSDISVVVKRKRGRPRKLAHNRNKPITHKRVTRLRTAHSYSVNYADINSDSTSSSATLAQEEACEGSKMSTFKPLGFEVSFLQFLEQSRQPLGKRKASVTLDANMYKRHPTFQLKTASVVCSRSDVLKLVEFKNPQKLTCLSNVKFEVHRSFSSVFELLLKQLHEMRPAVVIQKEESSADKS
uniref:Zinc finger protein 292b n=1 Tax=Astyanax mexicanus TaxID=7994 RepID=A0A8B9REI1_ASTMX